MDDQTQAPPEAQPVAPAAAMDYDVTPYADLQQEAKRRELNAGGTADELKARLREHDEAQTNEPASAPAPDGGDAAEGSPQSIPAAEALAAAQSTLDARRAQRLANLS